MLKALGTLSICLISLTSLVSGQESPNKSKSDYSQEAFVIEQFEHKEQFENDGTSLEESTARVRIQSDAGVQRYGLLTFSYASASGTINIDYVRVRKPDGSLVETPLQDVQDMTAELTRQAPFYSDLHEKHVAVKGLSVGDVVEYKSVIRTTKPPAPGQFWTAYEFSHAQIVLDERLEIRIPREREVKLKSREIQPVVSEGERYRIYSWRHVNLKRKDTANAKREAVEQLWKTSRGRLDTPDIELSSFLSWDQVGQWYETLQTERVKPTPEITAKALEITRNLQSDEAKAQALYAYVSTQFRYIGVSFGIGRYQPHAAGEVLANQYGDCKDKHTLLASLLGAAGISAYPALISTLREVNDEVPSPGQFNHLITVVPRGQNELVWLDATAEVGPYRYLVSPLRDKHALVVWKDKPAALVSTPPDLPYATVHKFSMDGKLNDSGTFEGHADFSTRGDVEYFLRSGFRTVPVPQWKDLVQNISAGQGFGGEVSEVTAGSPEKTDEPMHYSYKYTRKDFGDWKNQHTVVPLPIIVLPAPSEEEFLPLGPSWLGSPTELEFDSEVELPKGYTPELPAGVHLKQDFGQYDSSYQFKDGKLISKRHLKTLLREVPVNQREQYKKFVAAIGDDYGVSISLQSGSKPPQIGQSGDAKGKMIESLRSIPDSSNVEAMKLESDARNQMRTRDSHGAVSSLYRAVAADPQFTRAWITLGSLLLSQKEIDAGMEAFQKAIATDPNRHAIAKMFGFSLMAAAQFEKAVPVWQDYIKTEPQDLDGPSNLGMCLVQLKRYAEAAEIYEGAIKTAGSRADLQAGLASVYLQAGEREKAAAAFEELSKFDNDPGTLNNAAYEMAKAETNLPLAVKFAQKAVLHAEEESQKIQLADLKLEDLRQIFKLVAYWDTLGWVYARASQLDEAELYLRAAWKLTQDSVIASHLCQVYERLHKTNSAIQMCKLSVYRSTMSSFGQSGEEKAETQKRLEHLTGSRVVSTDASDTVIRERTYKMPRFLPGNESAEFFVLLASDGKTRTFKVEDVKFISGSEKMKQQGKRLRNVDFGFVAPDAAPAQFVRRGILGCYQYSGCSFVLLDPSSVSLN
jgi:tetratricopeptide (TPR) repeat protein/transglutaminase-like putative cysteine protease